MLRTTILFVLVAFSLTVIGCARPKVEYVNFVQDPHELDFYQDRITQDRTLLYYIDDSLLKGDPKARTTHTQVQVDFGNTLASLLPEEKYIRTYDRDAAEILVFIKSYYFGKNESAASGGAPPSSFYYPAQAIGKPVADGITKEVIGRAASSNALTSVLYVAGNAAKLAYENIKGVGHYYGGFLLEVIDRTPKSKGLLPESFKTKVALGVVTTDGFSKEQEIQKFKPLLLQPLLPIFIEDQTVQRSRDTYSLLETESTELK